MVVGESEREERGGADGDAVEERVAAKRVGGGVWVERGVKRTHLVEVEGGRLPAVVVVAVHVEHLWCGR